MSEPTVQAAHSERRIVHVDMDAFYASVEQRDDPSLRGRPVVVGGRGARSVVAAASYEARRFGVRSAMPSTRAERLCPEAVFVAPDFARYRAVSQQVRAIFARYTPIIEPLSLDEAYLDVTTHRGGLETATAVAEAIRSAIRNELHLTASAGVATNKLLAKLASDANKPDGICVVRPQAVDRFLLPLPLRYLPGVGPKTQQRLSALGLQTVADVRAQSEAQLIEWLGRTGERLFQQAYGIDERPVQAERIRKSVSAEDTLSEDLSLEALAPHITAMAEKTWRTAQRGGYSGRTVILKLKTADFRILTRHSSLGTAPTSADELAECATALLDRVGMPASTRFRLVGVGMTNLQSTEQDPQAEQHRLFD